MAHHEKVTFVMYSKPDMAREDKVIFIWYMEPYRTHHRKVNLVRYKAGHGDRWVNFLLVRR